MTATTKNLQPGTAVFTAFAILSAIVCVVKGLVPLYAIEAFLWVGLAALWHVKQITSKVANYTVLSLAFAVLLGNSFSIGRAVGYKAGYTGGIATGHTAGYKEGNKAGYSEGKEDGEQAYLQDVRICGDADELLDRQSPSRVTQRQRSCARIAAEKAKFDAKMAQAEADFLATIPK